MHGTLLRRFAPVAAGIALVVLFVCLSAIPAAAATNYSSIDTPLLIPDNGTATSAITINDAGTVGFLTVQVTITHPHDPDLTLTLIAPDGTPVILANQRGATGTQANYTNTVFDDAATISIANGAPPFPGHF